MKVGIHVQCAVCRYTKKPRGRSEPIGIYFCQPTCPGYDQPPYAGDLWPGETEKDFGYPVGNDGTREQED